MNERDVERRLWTGLVNDFYLCFCYEPGKMKKKKKNNNLQLVRSKILYINLLIAFFKALVIALKLSSQRVKTSHCPPMLKIFSI